MILRGYLGGSVMVGKVQGGYREGREGTVSVQGG